MEKWDKVIFIGNFESFNLPTETKRIGTLKQVLYRYAVKGWEVDFKNGLCLKISEKDLIEINHFKEIMNNLFKHGCIKLNEKR